MSKLKLVKSGGKGLKRSGRELVNTSGSESKRCNWTSDDTARPLSWSIQETDFAYVEEDKQDEEGKVPYSKGTIIFKSKDIGDYIYKVVREAFGVPDPELQPAVSDEVWCKKVKFLIVDQDRDILFLVRPIYARDVYVTDEMLQASAYFRIEQNVIHHGLHYEMEEFPANFK